jgi:hypothetical protein
MMVHPDSDDLRGEIEKLRTELSMLVLERDELVYVECKNIEMAYMLSVGGLEYKLYEVECLVLRARRKIEMIQARKNRQEQIVLVDIEEELDAEFEEYQEKLRAQIDKMNDALSRSRRVNMTDDEVREMKKLYRAIVKLLHPDLHPKLGGEKIRLFHNAVKAYDDGDLDGLYIIYEMIINSTPSDGDLSGLDSLGNEKERLVQLLISVKDEIASIKSSYPYTMKLFVQSRSKIEVRKAELERKVEQLSAMLAVYMMEIDLMLGKK